MVKKKEFKLSNKVIKSIRASVELRKKVKVGSRIEIIGNTIGLIKMGKKPPFYGTVTQVLNNEELLIRPLHQRWVGHWYFGEIKLPEKVS